MQGFTYIDLAILSRIPGSRIVCRSSFCQKGNEGERVL